MFLLREARGKYCLHSGTEAHHPHPQVDPHSHSCAPTAPSPAGTASWGVGHGVGKADWPAVGRRPYWRTERLSQSQRGAGGVDGAEPLGSVGRRGWRTEGAARGGASALSARPRPLLSGLAGVAVAPSSGPQGAARPPPLCVSAPAARRRRPRTPGGALYPPSRLHCSEIGTLWGSGCAASLALLIPAARPGARVGGECDQWTREKGHESPGQGWAGWNVSTRQRPLTQAIGGKCASEGPRECGHPCPSPLLFRHEPRQRLRAPRLAPPSA